MAHLDNETQQGTDGDDVLIAQRIASEFRTFIVDLDPLNESGVDGTASLVLNDAEQTLAVQISATGLEPGMVHPQHIHGRFADTAEGGPGSGRPIDSVMPNLLADDDNDGFIELLEGLDTYGPIIVPLTSPPGGEVTGFPVATDGTIDFEQVYDLSDMEVFADGFNAEDLTPLDLREIVLHGAFVPEGVGEGTPGEVDGGPREYLAVLPVASGEIEETFPGSIIRAGKGEDLLIGSTGADQLFGDGGNDTLLGAEGDDRLFGGGGNDREIRGGEGNDRLSGGSGCDVLYGERGDDRLLGGNGGDDLYGGLGDDRLVGGRGDDMLSGGQGADVFVFRTGEDVITDFNAAEGDELILANGASAEAALANATETDEGLAIDFGDGDMLTLLGATREGVMNTTDDLMMA